MFRGARVHVFSGPPVFQLEIEAVDEKWNNFLSFPFLSFTRTFLLARVQHFHHNLYLQNIVYLATLTH